MSLVKVCKLLKIYASEDSMYQNHNLYHELVLKFKEAGIIIVTVTRSLEGYEQRHIIHTTRILDLSLTLTVIIELVNIIYKY